MGATKLIGEPLLHFVVVGTVLFAAYAWLNRDARPAEEELQLKVHIGEGEVAWLKETWARQWQRPPDERELRGLVTDYLREELLAREARELGLDTGDTVVRRRLAQKMQFLVEDTVHLAEPNEDDLRRYYETNPQQFEAPAEISFAQVFIATGDAAAEAESRAEEVLARLLESGAQANPAELGDQTLLDFQFQDVSKPIVANTFGEDFAHELFELGPGPWRGPVESAYGLHLVRIEEIREARLLPFDEVRDSVLEEWRHQQQEDANEKYFASLLEKYDISVDKAIEQLIGPIERPPAADPPGLAGAR